MGCVFLEPSEIEGLLSPLGVTGNSKAVTAPVSLDRVDANHPQGWSCRLPEITPAAFAVLVAQRPVIASSIHERISAPRRRLHFSLYCWRWWRCPSCSRPSSRPHCPTASYRSRSTPRYTLPVRDEQSW